MVIAVPIEEYRRRPEDVLSAEFDLRYLWNLMPHTQIGEKGTTCVVNGEGYVIAHPDTKRVTSRLNVRHLPMVDRAIAGEEGIRLFKEKEFDIVLTDLGMPGLSGWEVCRMIKQIRPRTPVGMITGWGMEFGKSKLEEYGLDFLIPKPFEFNQILKAMVETLESKGNLFLS